MTKPLISIIILNFNGLKDTSECIASIIKTQKGVRFEIIIVDNGSLNDEAKIIKKKFGDKIQVFRLNQNQGFTGGNNWALTKSRGNYILLLNNDTVLGNSCLAELSRTLDREKEVAVVQPKIKYYFYRSKFDYAGACGGFLDRYGYPFTRGRLFENLEYDRGQYDKPMDIFWASGAAMMVRKSHIQKSGGLFNDIFFNYMEEIDFCWRVWNCGLKVKSVPQAVVFHKVAQTAQKNKFQKRFWEHRNNLILLALNLSTQDVLPVLAGRILLELSTYLHYALSKKASYLWALFCAHLHFIFLFPGLISRRRTGLNLNQLPIYFHSVCLDYFVLRNTTFSSLRW